MKEIAMRRTSLAIVALASLTSANAQEATLDAARAVFEATYPLTCEQGMTGSLESVEDEVHVITFTPDYDGATPETATLFGFACSSGAYNFSTVWFVGTEWGGIEPVAFARPVARYEYEDDESAVLASHEVTGMTADMVLVGAAFDPGSQTITSDSKWRGLGDARDGGTWRYGENGFVLELYAVDPTLNGEIDEPIVLYDAGS